MAEDGFEEIGPQGGEHLDGRRQGIGREQDLGQFTLGALGLLQNLLQLVKDEEEVIDALAGEQAVDRPGQATVPQFVGESGQAGQPAGLGQAGFQKRQQGGGQGGEGVLPDAGRTTATQAPRARSRGATPASASEDLPEPDGPTTVTHRCCASAPTTWSLSFRRPWKTAASASSKAVSPRNGDGGDTRGTSAGQAAARPSVGIR
ncbi:hypothetical protein NQP46_29550 [Streptomyces albus]|nr:hypothetical protein NQP46_29550 [Streptomyces albus]